MMSTKSAVGHEAHVLPFRSASIRFDRRLDHRRPISGAAQAVLFDAVGAYRLMHLELRDVSPGGFRAATDRPVAPGTHLRVQLIPHGPLYDASVVRCGHAEDGRCEFGARIATPVAA